MCRTRSSPLLRREARRIAEGRRRPCTPAQQHDAHPGQILRAARARFAANGYAANRASRTSPTDAGVSVPDRLRQRRHEARPRPPAQRPHRQRGRDRPDRRPARHRDRPGCVGSHPRRRSTTRSSSTRARPARRLQCCSASRDRVCCSSIGRRTAPTRSRPMRCSGVVCCNCTAGVCSTRSAAPARRRSAAPVFTTAPMSSTWRSVRSTGSTRSTRPAALCSTAFSSTRHAITSVAVSYGLRVTDLLRGRDGTIEGIRGQNADGEEIVAVAPIVIGADGVNSTIARLVEAPTEQATTTARRSYTATSRAPDATRTTGTSGRA